MSHPITITILYGLLAAMSFSPAQSILGAFLPPSFVIPFLIWSYLAFYGLLLTIWSEKRVTMLSLPLTILCIGILCSLTLKPFLFLTLAVLSWIRSSICFQPTALKQVGYELLLNGGGGLLVFLFVPQSTMGLAIGIWLFVLVQSLYFLCILPEGASEPHNTDDAFELARKQADDILKMW